MNLNELSKITFLALVLCAPCVQAQDVDENSAEDGELTMMLIADPEAQLPEAVTNYIELPMSASESGQSNSADGLGTVNDNRQRSQQGLDTADEARERAREFGQDISEAAQETRENAGRGMGQGNELDPPGPPSIPDPPNPPDPPGMGG